MLHSAMNEYNHLSALKIGERNITYNSLNKVSLQIASLLLREGVQRDNIGILGQRNYSVYMGILGSIYSGNTYVPINKKYPERKIKDIIQDANIKVLICSEEDWNQLNSILSSSNALKFVLIPEGDAFKSDNRIKTAFDLNNIDVITEPVSVQPSDNLYVMFTSGSTGKPKGVQVSNRNVSCLLDNMNAYYDLEPGFRASQTFDLSFDLSVSDMFFTWANGGTLCVLNEEELYCPAEYINREKIVFWHSVPTLAEFMYKLGFLNPQMYPSLRYSIFCGEPLTQRVANAWMQATPNSTVENLYGPTEATVFVSRYLYTEKDKQKKFNNGIVPIGAAFTNQRLKIVNKDDKIISKNNKDGELVVSGSQVTKGYLNDDEKTNQSFVRFDWDQVNDLWYRTGDLVFLNDDNNIEFIGRKDKQIKLAGRRIELGEIEYIIKKYGGLDEIVIVAKKDTNGVVEQLVAFTTNELSENGIISMQNKCDKYIESIFFPQEFIYIENIPTTINGKIDRVLLEKKVIEYI
ncbi:MAG: amino acid adenylation domain-containing protein [Candidatus Marinimicrobia bacterium]|nr:amino acid adenylation domain-containing protein [Candidatus Neomarinimicrobiota bacterium]